MMVYKRGGWGRPAELRMMRFVRKTRGCWWWLGSVSRRYGYIRNDAGKMQRVHRLSYELFVGPIPAKLYVLHKCDNPLCVNPKHLFVGNQQKNMDDMVAKGRQARMAGSANPRYGVKLSSELRARISKSVTEYYHGV